jgi:hypothetical protein
MTMPLPIRVSPSALRAVAGVLADLGSDLPAGPAGGAPDPDWAAGAAFAAVSAAAGARLADLGAQTRDTADRLRTAARGYEVTDDRAGRW